MRHRVALGKIGRGARDHERSGGIETDDVEAGAGRSREHVAGDANGVLEIIGEEGISTRGGEPELGGIDGQVSDVTLRDAGDAGDAGDVGEAQRADFIHLAFAVHDPGARGAKAGQRFAHEGDQGGAIDAQELVSCTSGVGERPEKIEDCREAQRGPGGGGVLRRGMMIHREAETDPRLAETAGLQGGGGVDVDAKRGEEFGASATGAAAVAMLGNPNGMGRIGRSGGGGDDGGECGDVEGLGRAARAAGIEHDAGQRVGVRDGRDMGAHGQGSGHEFVAGDAPGLHEGEGGGDLGVIKASGEEVVEEGVSQRGGEALAGDQAGKDLADRHVTDIGPRTRPAPASYSEE